MAKMAVWHCARALLILLIFQNNSTAVDITDTYNQSVRYYNSGDYDSAVAGFKYILEFDKSNILAIYNLAVSNYKLKKYLDAIKLFDYIIADASSTAIPRTQSRNK